MNVPDERLRAAAQKHRIEWNKAHIHATDEFEDQMQEKADFASAERDSALLEAAGLVCELCAKGISLERINLKHETGFYWHHKSEVWEENNDCAASPIHERRAQKGNG